MFSSDLYALNIETLIWEKLPSEVFTGAGRVAGAVREVVVKGMGLRVALGLFRRMVSDT